ncbi:2-phosphosulfolactate phosphatase [Nocardia sp. NPDC003482]
MATADTEFPAWASQAPAGVRFEWGVAGARALAPHCAALVVVDVLSFTTTVSVAVEAGTRVLPYPSRGPDAARFAADHDAELAVGRTAVSPEHPWSLSPAALRRAPAPARLVLPSPNGSAISAAVQGIPLIAACLRNATPVAHWIHDQGWATPDHPVAIIAAGEHWPTPHGLRPAIEDWAGAAAVITALTHTTTTLSPEAHAAASAYRHIDDIPAVIRDCASARELTAAGFAADVAIATELDTSPTVPVLTNGSFVNVI